MSTIVSPSFAFRSRSRWRIAFVVCGSSAEVAQQHARVVGKGAGDGHTLFLAAGELAGEGVGLVADADELEQALHLGRDLLAAQAAAAQWIGDVPGHRARRHEIEVLEDHADLFARLAQLLRREGRQLLPIEEHLAGGGALEQVDAAHERRLACAGKTDDAEDLTGFHRERDVLHRVDGVFAGSEVLGNVSEFDQVNSSSG